MAESEQVFNGRYKIVRPIARGGMAEVYLAHDELLDRPVALKVLFPELSVDKGFVERFRREAQAAANLSHPNIVSVYDFGTEASTPFIVMEYVDGKTLSAIIRSEGSLLADRAAIIGADVAAALAFAHRQGVVHRDVKPGNVLIDGEGNVKVTDFGIARAANSTENLTQTGAVMGTAAYFSPEQAQGAAVDARTDVYSLGVVLYEMVSGKPPFSGDSAVAIAYKHVQEPPPPLRTVNPKVPADFEAVVMTAMAKDRDQRYPTADELRADLLRFRQGRDVVAIAPVAATRASTRVQPAADRTSVVRTQAAAPPEEPHRTGAYIALLIAMLLALVGLLYLLGRTVGLFGGDTGTSTEVVVPGVVKLTIEAATTKLEDEGLVVAPQFELNDTVEPGVVFAQDPAEGTKVATGATVTLKVSQGATPVKVPDVTDEDVEAATNTLKALGLLVETTARADARVAANKVISQQPASGTELKRGGTVRLVVSTGKPKVQVPDVRNQTETEANDAIQNAGLRVRRAREASSTVPEGRVIRTDPAGGTEVEEDSQVTVVLSTGPDQATVPNVIGQTEATARKTLTDAGFTVRVEEVTTTNLADDGRVLDQDPTSGSQAKKGSQVTIKVGNVVASSSTTSSTSSSTTSTTA